MISYRALRALDARVAGDIGCYTLPAIEPLRSIDTCVSMGSSIANDLQIRFCGSGGQGLQLSARILADSALHDGWSVAHSQGYEPTSRGGLSRSDVVLSRGLIDYPLVTLLDVLVTSSASVPCTR